MTARKTTAKARATANTGVLHFVQDDGEKQRQRQRQQQQQQQQQIRGSFTSFRMTAKNNDNSNSNGNSKYRGPSTALIAKCKISFAQDDGFCSERSEELDGVERLEAVDGFG